MFERLAIACIFYRVLIDFTKSLILFILYDYLYRIQYNPLNSLSLLLNS